jgi:hypothetical protein
MQNDFQKLVEELIALGEDAQELALITELFPTLDKQAQKEMVESLSKERDALTKISSK